MKVNELQMKGQTYFLLKEYFIIAGVVTHTSEVYTLLGVVKHTMFH